MHDIELDQTFPSIHAHLSHVLTRHLFLLILVPAILFSNVMIQGYAVLDELALYVIAAAAILARSFRLPERLSELESVHRWIFLVFATYLVLESVRGMISLSDLRVSRFVVLFAAFAMLAVFLPSEGSSQRDIMRVARYVTAAGTIYLTAYFLLGLLLENVFDIYRFEMQGWVWSGTTAAVLPVYVTMPALAVIGASPARADHRLFSASFIAALLVAWYYDSRSIRIAFLLLVCLGFWKLGLRRVLLAALIYLAIIVIFPWTTENALTPGQFRAYVAESIETFNSATLSQKAWNFTEGVLPGVVPAIRHLFKRDEDIDKIRAQTLRRYDFDRKLAIIGSIRHATGDGMARLLFGTGYYTHRQELVSTFQQIATEYGYHWPASYDSVVRTATFNGMLVDTGLIGIGLLGILFFCSALQICKSSSGPRLASLAALGSIALSFLSSGIYDLVVVYLALMPRGALLVYHPATKTNPAMCDDAAWS
jgi:hypothetical protein